MAEQAQTEAGGSTFPRERFNRVISYYLECLEERGGYEAADPMFKHGQTFIEFPFEQEWCLADKAELTVDLSERGSALAKELRKRRGHAMLLYGYPLFVRWVERSARGWSGGFAIPVFLLPVDFELHGMSLRARYSLDWPRLNPAFAGTLRLRPEEKRGMMEAVGLLGADDPPKGGLAELGRRIATLDEESFPVREAIDPASLRHEPEIELLCGTGLYNRALLYLGERSPYTRGLERELPILRDNATGQQVSDSALRLFFGEASENAAEKPRETGGDLAEVVPLNDEQRNAVSSAFEKELTVVTGPPGTGKSQVVLSVIANAYLQGQRVLFASYNNQAVDVVETRMNALAKQPILLRAGKRPELRSNLLQYLSQMLSFSSTEADRQAE